MPLVDSTAAVTPVSGSPVSAADPVPVLERRVPAAVSATEHGQPRAAAASVRGGGGRRHAQSHGGLPGRPVQSTGLQQPAVSATSGTAQRREHSDPRAAVQRPRRAAAAAAAPAGGQ